MTPEFWKQVKELFGMALDLAPDRRAAFLDEACSGDELLRQEIESLLAAHEAPDKLVEKPVYEVAAGLLADTETMTGRLIGPYRIERSLGQGGMGEVYLARDIRLGRSVALKMLPSYLTNDPDRVRRFQQEARATSALNHPNIVTIHETGWNDNLHFIVTEYIEGETLRERMSRSPMKLSEILDIAIQSANALSVAHQAGIIHRDIKPENIMIRSDGYVKVLDFGLAKLTEKKSLQTESKSPTMAKVSTNPGLIMGTTTYMSPEQARGKKVDAQTDIYSLGVVLYEMIAGRVPFEGETSSDVIAAILGREAPPLSSYAQGVPDELERLVDRAIRKQKEERYQSIKEMLGELKELKEELELQVRQGHTSLPEFTQRRGASELFSTNAYIHTEQQARAQTTSSIEYLIGELKRHKIVVMVALGSFILAIGLTLGLYRWIGPGATKPSLPFDKVQMRKLLTKGDGYGGVISPDGKYVVYISRGSLKVRQVATDSTLELAPSVNATFSAIAFSRDSSLVYYSLEDYDNPTLGALYKVPTLGGTAQKLLERIGGFALSPDGKQLVFVRNNTEPGESTLMVAGVNGEDPRPLAVRKAPNSFGSVNWSPDGKLIAAVAINHDSGKRYMTLVAIPAEGGPEKPLTMQHWSSISSIVWLPDGSGIILSAYGQSTGGYKLSRLSYPDGALQIITNDFNSYLGVSITADGSMLASTAHSMDSNIWLVPNGDASRARQVTMGSSNYGDVTFTPDGKILFTDNHIAIMSMDGSGLRHLTFGSDYNYMPSMSSDGRYIVFISNRGGKPNVWRMNSDGGDLKRLTNSERDNYPRFSPDGKWVFYVCDNTRNWALCKVPLEGGKEEEWDEPGSGAMPAISPDGKLIAYEYKDKETHRYGLIVRPLDGGPITKTFNFSPGASIRWSPDGKGLTYISSQSGSSQLWYQPLAGGEPKQLTNFKSDENILDFDWSRDGKYLVCVRGRINDDVALITNAK
jgi:eukaryotic-like serine/threonine-protein kinase